MSDAKRILLVGHCLPDRYLLSRAVKKAIDGVEIEHANTDDALAKHLPQSHVLLVNRVLDGRFEHTSGVELIRELRERSGAACMLISNYEEAQAEAQQAGALPGFGKSELGKPTTHERLRAAAKLPDQRANDLGSDTTE